MVVDEPVGEVTLAQVAERPTEEVVRELHELAAEYDEQGRGFELRQVAGGWRFYTRAVARGVRRAVRARRAAGPADPGRAGDPGGGGLPAAGEPGPGLGGARRQRRRRDAHAGGPRPGRGGRARTARAARRSTARRRTSWSGWGCAASTSCPTWRRSCPAMDAPGRHGRQPDMSDDRAVRHPAAEGAGRRRARQPPRLRGADRGGPGRGRRQAGPRAGHAGRPGDGGHQGRRHADRDRAGQRLPRAEQAAAASSAR